MPDQSYHKHCTKCRELKSAEEFVRCSESKDGLHWWCKACFRKVRVARETPLRRLPLVEPDPLKLRRCARCGQMVPETDFGRERVTKGGFNYYCKHCIRQQATLRALRKALGVLDPAVFSKPDVVRALHRLARTGPVLADAQINGIMPQYAAGFFDGEGTVAIGKQKKHKGTKLAIYHMHVSIANTNKEVMERIRDTFGGSLNARKPRPPWKQVHVWVACSWKAATFLTAVSPYLVVKRKQAEIGLAFQKTIRHVGNRWRATAEHEVMRREALYQQMRVLNKRCG